MRKLFPLIAVAAAAAVGLLVARTPAAPALPDLPAKWQYGEFWYSVAYVPPPPRAPVGTPDAREVTARWATADGEVEGRGWEELAGRLKAPAAAGEGAADRQQLRVLTRLGQDGWELVYHNGKDVWTFKRRVP